MLRLVQLTHPDEGRRVAVVEGADLRVLSDHHTVYHLARAAIDSGHGLEEVVACVVNSTSLSLSARRQASNAVQDACRRNVT